MFFSIITWQYYSAIWSNYYSILRMYNFFQYTRYNLLEITQNLLLTRYVDSNCLHKCVCDKYTFMKTNILYYTFRLGSSTYTAGVRSGWLHGGNNFAYQFLLFCLFFSIKLQIIFFTLPSKYVNATHIFWRAIRARTHVCV